ncbi:MAG: hypothetical protein ACP5IL_17445 [Syntrophobacteraceae bacterium]
MYLSLNLYTTVTGVYKAMTNIFDPTQAFQVAYTDGVAPAVTLNIPAAGQQSLWSGAKDLGSGWMWLSWFGYFTTNSSPWIYHEQLGWLYPYGTDTSNIWFYDPAMKGGSFWWTSATVFPYVYRASDGAWLYYEVGSSNPRYFYNYSTKSWESD